MRFLPDVIHRSIAKTRRRTTAFSLVEIMVVMTMMVVLISFSVPSVSRTIEQSHADMAGASLRSIANAQRFFWLENRTYADTLQTLVDEGLLEAQIVNGSERYQFAIAAADAETFQATARRRLVNGLGQPVYDGTWQGTLTIDEAGVLDGLVSKAGSTAGGDQITPSF